MAKDPKPITSVNIYQGVFKDLAHLQRIIEAQENKDYSRCEFASRVIEAGIKALKPR